ncbi:hypothetical protein ID866_9488 [Astraeus odoratus]|nr:hypothetical protein ID866_9488 [Astraeus odoratus]
MWDKVHRKCWDEETTEKERGLNTTLWKSLIDIGARCERFYNTWASAWEIVRKLGYMKRALLLQKELVDEGMFLEDTTAGRQLQHEVFDMEDFLGEQLSSDNESDYLGETDIARPSNVGSVPLPNRPSTPISTLINSYHSYTLPRDREKLKIEVTDIRPNDNVIIFIGTTGSGMSNFINKLTGMEAESNAHGLISSTSTITAYRSRGLGGRSFVFVDTPGFDGTYASQSAVFKKIAQWLEMTAAQNFAAFECLLIFVGKEQPTEYG